jgi:quinoprotein glucose dehydrogenase
MVKYDLNTGDIVWRIPTGVQEAPPEYNIPNNTGVQFPRNAPLVTAGGLIFLAIGPERKVHAYDRATGKELWQHSLPNGAEGMPATYQEHTSARVHFAEDRGKPRIRAKGLELREVARVKQESRLAIFPRSLGQG